MKSYLLYGPPAGGKTTIAKRLAKKFNHTYLSVGQITREEIAKKSKNGLLLKKYLDEIVEYPVDLIAEIIEERLIDVHYKNQGSFILDGFPKYHWEAKEFLKMIEKHRLLIDGIYLIDVSLDKILQRASKRRICLSCLGQHEISGDQIDKCPKCCNDLSIREDDKSEIIKRRYSDYVLSIDKTLAVLGNKCGRVVRINGEKDQDEVLRMLVNKLA